MSETNSGPRLWQVRYLGMDWYDPQRARTWPRMGVLAASEAEAWQMLGISEADRPYYSIRSRAYSGSRRAGQTVRW